MKAWAKRLKRDLLALYLAARDPRTPLAAKLVAGATAAYAFSPIDLIPDFIPVIGLVDDLLIVPLGIWLAVRLIPDALMEEFRKLAERVERRPVSRGGMIVVIAIWLFVAALAGLFFLGG